MTHALTILTSADRPKKRATKIWKRGPSGLVEMEKAYEGAVYWTTEQRPVAGFADMCATVSALQEEPHSIIMLGQPKPGVDLTKPHRRKKHGKDGVFDDAKVHVLPVDLDNVRADHLDVIGDPGGAIQYAIDEVNQHVPELEGASCLAIFSSSAGVKDNTAAKLRLWYWLATPRPVADLKRWAKQVNVRAGYKLVDDALYQAVQPIYVARPVFENMPDPLPGDRRWAVIEGYSDAVELVIDADTPRTRGVKVGAGLRMHMGGGIERHLAEIGGVDGARDPAKRAIGVAIRQLGSVRAEQQRDAILARVAEAIENAIGTLPQTDASYRSPDTIRDYRLDRYFDWRLDRERESEADRVIMPVQRDTRPRLPLDQARKALREMMGNAAKALLALGWSADTSEEDPPALSINASLGVGKTEASGQTALDLVDAINLVDAGISPIAMAAPTHKLNAEVRERVRTMAMLRGSQAKIAMALGREAIDPDGDGVATMCTQLETVREVQRAGVTDIQSHVCRRVVEAVDAEGRKTKTEHLCPDFHGCRTQANREEVKAADIVLVAHAALGHTGAKTYRFVFVDENPVPAMLRGCDGDEDHPQGWITVTPADLSTQVLTRIGTVNRDKTAELEIDHPALVECRLKMADLQRNNGRGYVRRAALIECGFTAEQLREAKKSAYNLQQKALKDLVPGMDQGKRRELLKRFAKNTALRHEATLYGLLADFLDREELGGASGWVRWTTKVVENQRHDVWRLTYMGSVSAQYRAPTIAIDATMRDEYRFALRALFPGLRDDMGGEILVESPHRKVRAVRSSAWTLGQMRDPKGTPKEERGTVARERAREAQAAMVREINKLGGGKAVAVTNKAVAMAMTAAPVNGIDAVHFAVVRGLDRWRDARYQATFGRTQPPPESVEVMAGAITGKAVEPLGEKVWYPTVERPILGRDGTVLGYQTVPKHPDPTAEACRWQVAEAAVIQSERLRGVQRDETTPALWDLVGCPVPDGVEVDEVIDYVEPTVADLMLALGGLVLGNPAHAVAAFPEIWPVVPKEGETEAEALARTINAEKQAAKRREVGYIALIEPSIKGMYPTSYRYQVAGPGQKPAEIVVLPAAREGLRDWLESRLGPLAWLRPAEAAGEPAERQAETEAVSVPPDAPSPPAGTGTPLPPITGRVDVVLAGAVAVTLPPPRLHCAVNVTLGDVRVRACGTVATQPEPPLPPITASLVATLDDVRVSACGTVAPMPDPLPPLPAGPGSTAAWARLACSPCSHPPVRALACVVSEVARPPYPGRGGSPEAWRAYIFGPDALPPPPKPRVPGAVAPLDEWPLHWCPDCEREGHDKPDLYAINVKGTTTVWRCNRHDTHGVFEPPHIGDPGYPVKKANQ